MLMTHKTTFKTLLLRVFYILALCLVSSTARASNEDIEFNRLTNRDGLSNSHINAILRDMCGLEHRQDLPAMTDSVSRCS